MFRPVSAALLIALAATAPRPLAAQQVDSAPPPACRNGAADEAATMVSVVLPQPLRVIAAEVDSALHTLGYALSPAESSPGQWVTVPRFVWPAGSEAEPWHGDENPGVQLVVDLAVEKEGTRFSVAASAVCRVREPDGVETQLETAAALQVASSVATRLNALAPARP